MVRRGDPAGPGGGRPEALTRDARAILREVALRAETAVRIETDIEIDAVALDR